ncbi:MAG: hypothetical protein ABI778_12225 [Ignavibacteriota bacterium]
MNLLRFLVLVFVATIPLGSTAQIRKITHPARTTIPIPGLRREFIPDIAGLKIETNPGWAAEEIFDSTDQICQLNFFDPADSLKKNIVSILVEKFDSKGFDTAKWEGLKKSIRISYGDQGIAVRPLDDRMAGKKESDSTGILASYELLTRHPDFIEYHDAIVGEKSLVLLSAPMPKEEYQMRIEYLRSIAGSLRINKNK